VFDVETCEGEPYLLIFFDGKHVSFFKVDKHTILNKFIEYLLEHCNSKYSHILFAHNLPFDLTAVFTEHEFRIFSYKTASYLHWEDKRKEKLLAKVKIFSHKIWFAQIYFCNHARVKVVDSTNFLKGSLYDLSRTLNFKYKKRKRPLFVEQGQSPQNGNEWHELYRYCFDEIRAEYELAKYILGIHSEYDISFTVSVAQLSSKIFRKKFLKEPIPQIPEPIRKLAELTIHGGRASVFVPTPALIPNVLMYDYNSFYPFSMANLPNMTKGMWDNVDKYIVNYHFYY
jgi:hypothetical protein